MTLTVDFAYTTADPKDPMSGDNIELGDVWVGDERITFGAPNFEAKVIEALYALLEEMKPKPQ